MSIASRITAIEEHIRDVYDTIDYSYDTTDVDKNIINIPQNIFNGYINVLNDNGQSLWNNLEKVSASGEEVTLENVETAPMKMVLNGNTSQDTTTGKNKFSINEATYVKKYGSSYSVTGEEITVTPTTTWGNVTYRYDVQNNTEYTLKMKITFEGATQTRWWLSLGNETNDAIYNGGYIDLENGYLKKTFTTTSETLIISFQGSTTIQPTSVLFSDIQLELGSTATSWEKYTGGIPSPNPDYPQEVKVVTGENVVSVSGKNKFNINDITTNLVTLTGTEDNFNLKYLYPNNIVDILTNFESGKQYAFSGYFSSLKANGGLRVVYSDDTKTYLFSGWDDKERNKTPFNFVSDASKNIVSLQIILYSNADFTIENFQIEENSQATPYVPYSKTDYPISLGTIELCKIGNYQDYLYKNNGKWYVHKEIGKYIYNNDLQQNGITSSAIDFLTPVLDVEANVGGGNFNAYCNILTSTLINNTGVNGTTSSKKIRIRVSTNYGNSYEEIKSVFENKTLTIYYPLTTPTEEEITDTTLIAQLEAINNAKSVKDKTYITQTNDDLPFILDVEAIKEYEVV